MESKMLQVVGKVALLGTRTITIKSVVYLLADVYVDGFGAAVVFLDKDKSVDALSGFTVGVYQGRLSVAPAYKEGPSK